MSALSRLFHVSYILQDILLLIIAYCVMMLWFPLTNEEPFEKYNIAFLLFSVAWIFFGILHLKYKREKNSISVLILRSLYSGFIVSLLFLILFSFFPSSKFSVYVLIAFSSITLVLEITVISIKYAFRRVNQENEKKLKYVSIKSLSNFISEKQYEFLADGIEISDEILNIYNDINVSGIFHLETKDNFLCLQKFNKIKELNLFLAIANLKMSKNGLFFGFFETKNARKKRILTSSCWGLNYLLYAYDYLYKRFFPKFYLTSSIFSLLYTKTDKIFSKTEMYGRLYCAGFEYVKDRKIDGYTWFSFRKIETPRRYEEFPIGSLIGLKRIGKNKKLFTEYKFRTMYPYSEYLQSFMINNNSLQSGGKIYKDIRITRIGTFMRKWWIDEFPQFINLLKGDVKIVGVRPLSIQYFNLYHPELQKLRIKYKPGIFPPFYADLPKTLNEIQDSEMRYLQACEKEGCFKTDCKYLKLILKNIILKKVRSK